MIARGDVMNCKEYRGRLEVQADDSIARRHVMECNDCAEYAQLQQWAARVVRQGELEATPPLMSAVWASIHRASEQAWDSALTLSFRRLLPYMVAIVGVILLVGGLGLRVVDNPENTPTPVAASSPYAIFTTPPTPTVYTILSADTTTQDPGEVLGIAH